MHGERDGSREDGWLGCGQHTVDQPVGEGVGRNGGQWGICVGWSIKCSGGKKSERDWSEKAGLMLLEAVCVRLIGRVKVFGRGAGAGGRLGRVLT